MGFINTAGFVHGQAANNDGSNIDAPAFRQNLGVAPLPWEVDGCLAAWDHRNVTLGGTGGLKVLQWSDRTGNDKHLVAPANDAHRGVWTETGVNLAGGTGYTISNGGLAVNFRAMTVIGIFRTYTGSQGFGGWAGMFFRVAATSPGVYFGEYNCFEYGQGANDYVSSLVLPPNGSPGFYAAVYDTAENVYYNSGGRFVYPTPSTAGTGTLNYMFSREDGGSATVMPALAVLVFNRKLTQEEISRIVRYYGCDAQAQRRRLACVGSSTPAGFLASSYQASVIPKLASKLGCLTSCGGVNGRLLGGVGGVASIAQAEMVADPGQPNDWLFFMTSNDIAIAAPTVAVAQYQTDMTTHLTRLRAANPTGRIIVVDMPPRKGSLSGGQTEAGYETDRQTLNAWAAANKATLGIDILVSFNDSSTIGQQADVDNTTYYNVDKIHLTDLGHTELANLIGNRILQFAA